MAWTRHPGAHVKRPLPPAVLLVALGLVAGLHLLTPRATVAPYPVNLAGLVPIAAGIWLNLAADRLLKRHRTTVKPFQEPAALVTTGPYAHTRNPMYLGFAFILLGAALLLGTAWTFAVAVVFPPVMEAMYIRAEEAALCERFGPQWAAYQSRVRRWLPLTKGLRMTRIPVWLLALALVTAPACAPKVNDPADEQALLELERGFTAAAMKGDMAFFERHVAKEYVQIVDGKPVDFRAVLAEMASGQLRIESAALGDMRAHVVGDAAIVSLAGKATGTYRGKPFADGSRGFDVFAKRDGRWQVVYSQMTSIRE